MRFHVLTLFPQMIEQGLSESITGRALKQNIISLNTVNIRDFAHNKHNKVDDYTYGGGAGMLMQAEPVYQAVRSVVSQINKCNQVHSGDNSEKNIADENILYENTSYKNTAEEIKNHNARLIYVTPQGSVFNQQMAAEFAKCDDLIFLCGHYEGIDERVLEETVTDYVSIGDYVLTGGELPSMVMIDAISRLVPGVLHNDISAETESFHGNLLEYPQYSRPVEWHGKKVPEVLMSGNQKKIDAWRLEKSIERTKERRPDLYAGFKRLDKCREFLMKNKLLHIDMIELINRGCAEILFEADGEYLLRDMVSKVCFHTRPDEGGSKLIDLAPENVTKSVDKYSSQHIPENVTDQIVNGIVLHQQRYVELFTANGFNETVECMQAVYTNKEKLSVSGLYRPDGKPMPNGLIIRKLDAADIQEAAPMYPGFDNPDYIVDRIEAGAVYGAFFGDNTANDTINTLAGIIGIHEEGSIGMLYVKPQYRHRKLATALETYAFNMALENGCNVSGGNGSGSGSGSGSGNNPAVPYGTAKTATFTGYVNTGALNVRKQPDPDADKLVSYPCIKQNTEVGVCGSAKAPNGALWYYIYIDGAKGKKYGYVNARYITAK